MFSMGTCLPHSSPPPLDLHHHHHQQQQQQQHQHHRRWSASAYSNASFSFMSPPSSSHGSFSPLSKLFHRSPMFRYDAYFSITTAPCSQFPSTSAQVSSLSHGQEEKEEQQQEAQLNEEDDACEVVSNPGLANSKIRRFPFDRSQLSLDPTPISVQSLNPIEQEKVKLIMKWKVIREISKERDKGSGGRVIIRALRLEQLGDVEDLLTDSYSELMWGPLTYRPALAWILATYLRERQACLPHAVTLVALYAPSKQLSTNNNNNDCISKATNVGDGDGDNESRRWLLVGAVELSFNALGKPKDMQTPRPPVDAPFLSNMAVSKKFRRKGIGRELLQAAEELAVQMGCREMYLHCRIIDEVPLNMYKKYGYKVIETDSILTLLTLQRRRHLMRKTLPSSYSENSI